MSKTPLPRRHEGKRALISGAAGSLGSAIARRLAAEGARVLIADINLPAANALAQDIGPQARACHLDAYSETSIAAMVATAVEAFGGLDLLVNNVADTSLALHDKAVLDVSTELWDKTFAASPRATFLATRYALPHLLATGNGAIVHMASAAGLAGDTGLTAYGTAKAAIIHFNRSVAAQYGRQGVRSNAVCPGMIVNDAHREELADMYQAGLQAAYAKRNGEAHDIAAMVAYLASDEAGFVNGAAMVCDGGQSAVMKPWRGGSLFS